VSQAPLISPAECPRQKPYDCRRVVQILKAAAHPLRLQIVATLCDGERKVSTLAAELDSTQAIVSQQLRILRMTGLVDTDRMDGHAVYRLAAPHHRELIQYVQKCCARANGATDTPSQGTSPAPLPPLTPEIVARRGK